MMELLTWCGDGRQEAKTITPIKIDAQDKEEPHQEGLREIASPMRDIPLKIMKHPTAPATIPMAMAVIKGIL